MTAATLPSPLSCVGVVTVDSAERTLIVQMPDTAEGYARLLWRQGHQALLQSERTGFYGEAPTVYASAPGADSVGFALPGDNATLRFRFHVGDPIYKQLVSTPGLTATVMLDRSACQIMSVRFRHGRKAG